ncbi:MAG: hypothetical protein AB7U98_13770 [Candidatus Nitrosocosmicus sp.]
MSASTLDLAESILAETHPIDRLRKASAAIQTIEDTTSTQEEEIMVLRRLVRAMAGLLQNNEVTG